MNTIALTYRFVISGSRDKSIKVFDLHTKQQVHHFQNAHDWFVKSLAVTSDSRFIVSGSEDQSIKIFDLLAKHQLQHLPKAHDRKEMDLLWLLTQGFRPGELGCYNI